MPILRRLSVSISVPIRALLYVTVLVALPASAQPVTQPFTFSNAPHTLPHLEHGDVTLGDYDLDGDLDAYVSGLLHDQVHAGLYRNDGGGEAWTFSKVAAPFPNLAFGAAAWGDYDGDGDLDLVVTGSRTPDIPYDAVTLLYRNDDGSFARAETNFDGFHSGGAVWSDFDNDGDLDLVVGGERTDGTRSTLLYRSDEGRFENAAELDGIAYGDLAPGDFDGDGDVDLAATGVSANGIYSAVWENDGTGRFSLHSTLDGAAFSSADWGDMDGDGDLDLLISGASLSPDLLDPGTQLYRNDDDTFTRVDAPIPDVASGSVAWGDYDNDADLDILVIGTQGVFAQRLARIFASEDSVYLEKIRTVGVLFGAAEWGDLEGDGDLDLVVTGLPTSNTPFINLYQNDRQVRTAFAAPEGLHVDVSGPRVTLSWRRHPEAASYNLRVGSEPGASDILSPMATDSGRRLLARSGNAQQNLSRRVHDLPPGHYFWSVQAVDASFFGSRFAAEQTFTVAASTARDPERPAGPTRLLPVAPNPTSGPVTLQYVLAGPAHVQIRLYDVLGRALAALVDRHEAAGEHRIEWDGRDTRGVLAGSGLYIVRLEAGSVRQSTSFVLSR